MKERDRSSGNSDQLEILDKISKNPTPEELLAVLNALLAAPDKLLTTLDALSEESWNKHGLFKEIRKNTTLSELS